MKNKILFTFVWINNYPMSQRTYVLSVNPALTAIMIFLLMSFQGFAQFQARKDSLTKVYLNNVSNTRHYVDLGLGFGLDYGGLIGVKAAYIPIPYLSVFAAGGWELIGVGWNVGVIGRISPTGGLQKMRPYAKVMYGVNGVITVSGKPVYDQMFYGVSAGIGLEARFGRSRRDGFNIDLNIPFRSPEFFNELNVIKADPEVEITNDMLPFTFSVGYHHEF
jgi:hypothetical protein